MALRLIEDWEGHENDTMRSQMSRRACELSISSPAARWSSAKICGYGKHGRRIMQRLERANHAHRWPISGRQEKPRA